MIDNIRVAFNGLSANKLRSALTMLGITIGIAAVIVLVSLGQAVQDYIMGQFTSIGTNLVMVIGTIDDFGRPKPLTMNDANALRDVYRVPDALYTVPILEVGSMFEMPKIGFAGKEVSAQITGAPPLITSVLTRKLEAGRWYTEEEEIGAARVAVIGMEIAERLFTNGEYPIGQSIRIQGVRFQVVGVMQRVGGLGSFAPGGGEDNTAYVPFSTAQQRITRTQTVSGDQPVTAIMVQARSDESVTELSQQIRETLREEHNIMFQGDDDFEVATQDDLLSSLGTVTGILTLFLAIIAGISLLVGGIGIMNIMMVTVTERTREIGLRKAVGAQKFSILFQFLVEATILALVGGFAGVVSAWALAYLISVSVPDLVVNIQLSSILLATIISISIGIFFGIYPANRAASLNPIDALRYE